MANREYIVAGYPNSDRPGRTSGFDNVTRENIDKPNKFGMQPILVAFAAGVPDEAKNLLDLGADISARGIGLNDGLAVHDIVMLHAAEGKSELAKKLNGVLEERGIPVDPVPPSQRDARENVIAMTQLHRNHSALFALKA